MESLKIGGLGLVLVQFVVNLAPSAYTLAEYGSTSMSAQILCSIGVALAVLLFVQGVAAFFVRSVFVVGQFVLLSVLFAAVFAAGCVASIVSAHDNCRLNQLSFRGCNNFTETLCAIDNSCTMEALASFDCEAPTEDLCGSLDAFDGALAAGATLTMIFNLLAAGLGFCHALILSRGSSSSSNPGAARTISPGGNDFLELQKKVEAMQEEIEALKKKKSKKKKKEGEQDSNNNNDMFSSSGGDETTPQTTMKPPKIENAIGASPKKKKSKKKKLAKQEEQEQAQEQEPDRVSVNPDDL